MERKAKISRKTSETEILLELDLDGTGKNSIETGIPFFNHMLTLFSVHGFMDLSLKATGDIDVDFHHTVEDVGLVLGEALSTALSDRAGIVRYGYAVTPMEETLCTCAVDLSNRPFLVYNIPLSIDSKGMFDTGLAKEFFRAFSNKSGMNLHINVPYGENEHHIIESIFKSLGRAIDHAVQFDGRISGTRSSKGSL